MQINKYITLPNFIGNEIGQGADGQCFEIKNDIAKVIKYSIIFNIDDLCKIEDLYQKRSNAFFYLENQKDPAYVCVHTHKFLTKGLRDTVHGKQEYLIYYYIMDKLNKISDDEKKIFHTILSHEDANKNKNISIFKIKKDLEKISGYLDFSEEQVILFCENIVKSKLIHEDLHVRNIMKDIDGNFKLVDCDRLTFKHGDNYKL